MSIEQHIRQSHPLSYRDLDWELAAQVGLTESEKIILRYVSDVEGQTIFYLREILGTRAAEDGDALTFMTIWNYEEFFHGHAIAQLLDVCGAPLSHSRRRDVRVGAQFVVKAEAAFQWLLARIMPDTFNALYLSWASSQEFLTRLAYEQVAATTRNPVLKTLCLRIAKQERRHFAWYFNSAKEKLGDSKISQRVVRLIFEKLWSPVGVGVKTRAEAHELVSCLFPGPLLQEAMKRVDGKIGCLPGLEGVSFAQRYADELIGDAN